MAEQKNKYRIQSIHELYTVDWSKPSGYVTISDSQVPLPKKPPLRYFKNYQIVKENQKFYREEIPKDLKRWDKALIDKFVEVMYHKRYNGEWWLINGKEVYLTGKAWTYLNFWELEIGGRPTFRYELIEFFQFWEMCYLDPNCYGILDIKARRLGDTEKSLFLVWEECTRLRNSRGGMQNIKESDASDNFQRVVVGNNKMIWFFKPIMAGLDKPKSELIFDYPPEVNTAQKMKKKRKNGDKGDDYEEQSILTPAIESTITYETTKLGRYDGKRLRIYHLDEPGKILEMPVKEQWNIVKQTLHLYNGKKIVGKALLTTTVEDFEEGTVNTMQAMKWFWENSNPNNLDANGRTGTGLRRYFRSCLLSSEPDEFGMINVQEAMEWVGNTVKYLESIGDFDGLADLKRKQPIHIEDVFSIPHKECVLFPVLLDKRIHQIEANLHAYTNKNVDLLGYSIRPKAVRGDLHWISKFGGEVAWIADPNGRWCISQHPIKPNERIVVDGKPRPCMDTSYTFGVDPIDAMLEGKGKHSEAGGVVYRRYDELKDGYLERDDQGRIIEAWRMESAQFVCDYLFRTQDPNECFEDLLKTAIYYSVPMFYERDKPSVGVFFETSGFYYYMKSRPMETDTNIKKRIKKGRKEKGAKATPQLIRLYVDRLKGQVYNYIDTFNHLRILRCHRQFNVENRTERDLTVAAGFALLADMDSADNTLPMSERFDAPLFELFARHYSR
jgi:hypothetical protein